MRKDEENKRRSSSIFNSGSIAINFTVSKTPVEISINAHPSIKVNGFTVFSGSDLDNTLMLKDMKRGVLPKHVAKAIAEEVGTSTEKVLAIYADAVSKIETDKVTGDITTGVSKTTHTGTLDPISWFTDGENPTFKPFLCAKDYLSAYPDIITEYSGVIHQFTGRFWLRDAEGTIRTNIESAGVGAIKPRQIQEAVESIRNLTRITDPDKMDLPIERVMPLPDHTIPLDDGLFNLLTRALVPHSPDHYYTECLPRKYIPGATPEVFLSFLGFLFKGDPDTERKITQIFEAIAWILMPNYSIQGTVILYGQGGEGKSILHDIIAETIVHTTSLTLSELETDKFKRAELQGSWANLVSESTSEIITSEWFKRLTDGTTFTADRKNQHPFQFASRAKMILDVNELPNKERELRAFYRRVITIIDFPNLLELVLTPAQIDEFVTKLKDPAELDRIFSYVIDHFYAPLVSRMKFTSQLSISDAEQKWQERSNPAMSYLKAKDASGEILTDVEDVKVILASEPEKVQRYIARDKDNGEEHLTMVKADVIAAAVKWANQRGFPGKTINAKTMGYALESLGYSNLTVSKRITKGTILKAWKDIFIDLPPGASKDVTDETDPPKTAVTHFSFEKYGSTEGCNGCDTHSPPIFYRNSNMSEDRKTSVTDSHFALGNAVETPVTDENAPSVTQPLQTQDRTPPAPLNFVAQSENPPITEKEGRLIIVQLLNLGYHIDPNSGPDINRKFFVIRIAGFNSLSSDTKENLLFVMAKEHFTMATGGSHSVVFARSLASASDSAGNSAQSDPESIRYEIVEAIRTEAPKSQYGSLTPDAVYKIIGGRFQDIRVAEIKEICEQEYNKGTLIRRGPGYFYNSEGA